LDLQRPIPNRDWIIKDKEFKAIEVLEKIEEALKQLK
jgi:hypothetical protein